MRATEPAERVLQVEDLRLRPWTARRRRRGDQRFRRPVDPALRGQPVRHRGRCHAVRDHPLGVLGAGHRSSLGDHGGRDRDSARTRGTARDGRPPAAGDDRLLVAAESPRPWCHGACDRAGVVVRVRDVGPPSHRVGACRGERGLMPGRRVRAGYVYEGTLRQAMRYPVDGRWSDEHLHARLATDGQSP